MSQLLRYVSDISPWLYLACAVALLIAVRAWWNAMRDERRTIYQLEREVAWERGRRALTAALGALALAVLVYFANVTASTGGPVERAASPTPNLALLFNTPTPAVPTPTAAVPPSPTPLRGQPPLPRPTVRPSPTSTPQRPAPAAGPTLSSANCPDSRARIVSPGAGALLSGSVPIIGTANIDRFQFYKVEIGAGAQPNHWSVVGVLHREPVINGMLETLIVDALPAGTYTLRLTVVDNTGNYPIQPCQVHVSLVQ